MLNLLSLSELCKELVASYSCPAKFADGRRNNSLTSIKLFLENLEA